MDRFWSKVDKSGDCWEWLAAKNQHGYGKLSDGKHGWNFAHRLVLELEGIDIPSGMCVCHTCDNPGCVNPDHLFLATHRENMGDMARKGRAAQKAGVLNGRSKLTEEDVRWIRQIGGTNVDVGRCFGVSNVTISDIRSRKLWPHIE